MQNIILKLLLLLLFILKLNFQELMCIFKLTSTL